MVVKVQESIFFCKITIMNLLPVQNILKLVKSKYENFHFLLINEVDYSSVV